MRTTFAIDDDVLDQAREYAQTARLPFRVVVNQAMRVGLDGMTESAKISPHRTKPHNMGLKPGYNLDRVQELLALVEGTDVSSIPPTRISPVSEY